jgi:hypothetical protein
MPRRHDQPDFVLVDVRHLQALLLDGQLREAEVGDVFHDRIHHARAVGTVHLKLHGGKQVLVLGEHLRQHVDAGGLVGGDHQFAARVALQLVDGVLGLAALVQHLGGVIGEDLAGGGQGDAAAEALEKRGVELLLELPYLRADGRLRAVARLGGFREAFQPDDFEERVQLVEVHALRPPVAPAARRASAPKQNMNGRDRNNQFPSRQHCWYVL